MRMPLSTTAMPRVGGHPVEQVRYLAVSVPEEEPRPAAGVLEVHDEVLRGLRRP